MEPRCDELIDSGFLEKIARELFDGELIEGHVCVEGLYDPVAVRPHAAGGVDAVAIAVGIARLIQPPAAPAFTVMR